MKRGEYTTLAHALRRVRRLDSWTRSQPKTSLALPEAIRVLMVEHSVLWRWQLTEDGVLLTPVDEAQTERVAQGNRTGWQPQLRYTGPVDTSLPSWAEPKLAEDEPVLEET